MFRAGRTEKAHLARVRNTGADRATDFFSARYQTVKMRCTAETKDSRELRAIERVGSAREPRALECGIDGRSVRSSRPVEASEKGRMEDTHGLSGSCPARCIAQHCRLDCSNIPSGRRKIRAVFKFGLEILAVVRVIRPSEKFSVCPAVRLEIYFAASGTHLPLSSYTLSPLPPRGNKLGIKRGTALK